MSFTTGDVQFGRLGNQIIRNLATSLIAEKHNLNVDYYNNDLIKKLGIELFSGNKIYGNIRPLTDDNYIMIYNSDKIYYDLNPNNNYFQTKEITNILYNYLHTSKIKSNVIEKNPYKDRYQNNNDLYIHIRLGDVEKFNPGIIYYINAIRNIKFDNIYFSTDSENHDVIKKIIHHYPKACMVKGDEISTFQFASTCKHIVLSHGSFSAIIGYLSFFSNIYFPMYEDNKKWYGDMFSIDGWNKLSTV